MNLFFMTWRVCSRTGLWSGDFLEEMSGRRTVSAHQKSRECAYFLHIIIVRKHRRGTGIEKWFAWAILEEILYCARKVHHDRIQRSESLSKTLRPGAYICWKGGLIDFWYRRSSYSYFVLKIPLFATSFVWRLRSRFTEVVRRVVDKSDVEILHREVLMIRIDVFVKSIDQQCMRTELDE